MITCTGLAASPVKEEERLSKVMTELIKKTNFSGWSGVYFVCEYEANETAETICQSAKNNASFLAAAININLIVNSSFSDFLNEDVRPRNLLLTLRIISTNSKAPAAIAVNLEAAAVTPGNIVSSKPQELWPGKNLAGKLVFWSRYAIGATDGGKTSLVPSINDAVEQLLKEFFTDYATAKR